MPNMKQNYTYGAKNVPDPKRFGGIRQLVKQTAAPAAQTPAAPKQDFAPPAPPAPAPAPQAAPAFNAQSLGTVTTKPGEQTAFEKGHQGLDIAGPEGQKVPAFQPGKVTEVKTGQPRGSGYGNSVIIVDEFGNKHRYSHLRNAWVRVGDTVQQGQSVGEQGRTGATYSPSGGNPSHIDYRAFDSLGRYLNPTQFVDTSSNEQPGS